LINIKDISRTHGNTKLPHDSYHMQLVRDTANKTDNYADVARKLSEKLQRSITRMTAQRYMKKYGIEFAKPIEPNPSRITKKARVLYFDLETRMGLQHKPFYQLKNYSRYDNNKQLGEDVILLCLAWKWAHESTVYSVSVASDKERFANDPSDDYYVTAKLVSLVEQADVAIAHNGEKFDMKKLRTRCIANGFNPFCESIMEDTLKIAKSRFDFASNALAYIATRLELPEQKGTPPKWEDVRNADYDIIKECESYCRQDIRTLVGVAERLLPWKKGGTDANMFIEGATDHPNLMVCANVLCQSDNIEPINNVVKKTRSKYQAMQCNDCGHIFGVGKNLNKRLLTK